MKNRKAFGVVTGKLYKTVNDFFAKRYAVFATFPPAAQSITANFNLADKQLLINNAKLIGIPEV